MKLRFWRNSLPNDRSSFRFPISKRGIGIAGVITGAAIGLYALHQYAPDITGFGSDHTTNVERNAKGEVIKIVEVGQSAKSVWDWLSVLGVPFTLAVLGYWLQQLQQQRAAEESKLQQLKIEEQAKLQRQQTDEEAKEEVLQAYFDRISTLLIDKNLIAIATKIQNVDERKKAQKETLEDDSERQLLPHQSLYIHEDDSLREQRELVNAAKDVIRARTLSTLRRFENDPKRKEDVIRFLAETEIISRCELDLGLFNLTKVELGWANLSKVNLYESNLSGANLRASRLIGANLSGVNFKNANLAFSDLDGTFLYEADFEGAKLWFAKLTYAKGWTDEQLSKAKLCNTKLPKGSKLNPNRDCEEFGVDPDL